MLTFALFDTGGAPLLGAAPAFLVYADGAAAARTPPAIEELGGGLYGFESSFYDEQAGTGYLIDAGAGASPRYYSGSVGLLVALAFYDQEGAPMPSASPTVADYRGADGSELAQPTLVSLGSGLFAFAPSDEARAARAAYLVTGGVGAEPTFYSGNVPVGDPQPEIPEISLLPGAKVLNLTIEQGATWKREFVAVGPDGNPLDLTGYTARMEIRSAPGGSLHATPVVAITDAAAGRITAHLSATQTGAFRWAVGAYDIEIEAGGVVMRLYRGTVSISPQVTVG